MYLSHGGNIPRLSGIILPITVILVASHHLPVQSTNYERIDLDGYHERPSRKAGSAGHFIEGFYDEHCGRYKIPTSAQNKSIGAKRMSHGTPVELGQFPSFIALQFFDSGIVTCGATLIASDLVITAAHCVHINDKFKRIRAAFVNHNQFADLISTIDTPIHTPEVQVANVRNYCRHKKYKVGPKFPGSTYDLAVLQLDRKLTFNEYVQPACVLRDNPPKPDENVYLVGYGTIRNSTGDPFTYESTNLNYLVMKPTECSVYYNKDPNVSRNKPRNKGGSCPGDSGSGLFVARNNRHYLAALVSSIQQFPNDTCAWGHSLRTNGCDLIKMKSDLLEMINDCY